MASKPNNGCLSAWLTVLIFIYSTFTASYLFSDDIMSPVPDSVMTILGVLSILNLICVIFLFWWEKWGFWGLVVIETIEIIIALLFLEPNLIGVLSVNAVPIVILYGLFQIRKDGVKLWEYLD